MTFKQRLFRHPLLVTIAICTGIAIAGADAVLFNQALGRPVKIDEPIVFGINALLFALPLIALSLQGKQHVSPWLLGVGFSTSLAWWWLQKGVAYQRSPDGSGADIGGAIILLLAPFGITAVCLLLNRRLDSRKVNGS
jgi:hypothetical protein